MERIYAFPRVSVLVSKFLPFAFYLSIDSFTLQFELRGYDHLHGVTRGSPWIAIWFPSTSIFTPAN